MTGMNHFAGNLPLAALADLVEAVVPLIVMVMWAVSQLVVNKPKPRPPVRQRPAAPLKPAGPASAGGGQPPTLEETLRREVEEFMRRAQGREPARAPNKPSPPEPSRRESRPARPAAETPPRVRRLTEAPAPLSTPQVSQPIGRSAPLGAGVGQHVAQHLGGVQQLAAHAQHLGADVAQSDAKMSAHLQQKFSHQVGALAHQGDDPLTRKDARSPAAQTLMNFLIQPGGIRQIILASEILRRPEERWAPGGSVDASKRG